VQTEFETSTISLKSEVDPAARTWRRAGEGAQGNVVKSRTFERLGEEARFPIAGGVCVPMLQAAPSARAEMRAWRGNAVWAWSKDFFKSGSGAGAGREYFFAWKGQRHPGSMRIGAVSVGADAGYCEFFGRSHHPTGGE